MFSNERDVNTKSMLSSTMHGEPNDLHITARVFSGTDTQNNIDGVYLGGVHFQLDGSAPQFWQRKSLNANSPFAGMRRKKDWNQAKWSGELARSTVLGIR